MFEVIVRDKFSAAHRIENYAGNCASLHGHNWTVEVVFGVSALDELGMALDFRVAKGILRSLLAELDHSFLNENSVLGGKNPTVEQLALHFYNRASCEAPSSMRVASVTVWEADNAGVRYYE